MKEEKKAKEPVLLVSVAAVFKTLWEGKGFVEDLKPEILSLAPKLGDVLELIPELIKGQIGSGDKILAYGKEMLLEELLISPRGWFKWR